MCVCVCVCVRQSISCPLPHYTRHRFNDVIPNTPINEVGGVGNPNFFACDRIPFYDYSSFQGLKIASCQCDSSRINRQEKNVNHILFKTLPLRNFRTFDHRQTIGYIKAKLFKSIAIQILSSDSFSLYNWRITHQMTAKTPGLLRQFEGEMERWRSKMR